MTSSAAAGPCCGLGRQASEPPPRGLVVASAVFLSIFFATFLILMSLAFCCCRRWRQRDAVSAYADGGELSTGDSGGGDPFPVEALPAAYAYVGSSDDGKHGGSAMATAAGGERECAVCLGTVREGEMVRRLPACEHVYHAECIDRWLATHRTCPLCRCELHSCKLATGAPPAPAAQEGDPVDQLPV